MSAERQLKHDTRALCTCACCGLVQWVPPAPAGMKTSCRRCGTGVTRPSSARRGNAVTAALALAALVLYPLAISLPMIRVEQFGHHQEASIIKGAVTLMGSGQIIVGLIVLICSVVLPLGKLLALLTLSSAAGFMGRRHRAFTYRVVKWTGRWGMLDVLLVAILVAVLKIGDLMEVSAGPAALAFTSCVVLSLLASASFDPHALWVSGVQDKNPANEVNPHDHES